MGHRIGPDAPVLLAPRHGKVYPKPTDTDALRAQRETMETEVSGNSAKRVVKLYSACMQIEEAFRDLKSHRFGLSFEHHGTRDQERLQLLLLIAAFALMLLWLPR